MSVRSSAPPSLDAYLALVRKSGLISEEALGRALGAVPPKLRQAGDAHALARILLEKGLLTPWQNQYLMRGKHKGFFLGKYKLLKLLGAGGMGAVYLAEHTLMHRRVALKVLPTKSVADERTLERFLTEAQAIAALDHPNIIRAFNVDSHDRAYYLVMEYVEGKDLEQLVKQSGPLDPEQAVRYLRQAADGLAHAHERGMVHRDIKPSNLLADANGHLKILDLGLAVLGRSSGEDEASGSGSGAHGSDDQAGGTATVAGTMDYIAPEAAMGAAVDQRSDLYSLGCTLYYLLVGAPPFPSRTMHELLIKHQTQEPPAIDDLRPDVNEDLAGIARKLMAKKPADRFATAAQLSDVLGDWLTENSSGAAPTQVWLASDDTLESDGIGPFHFEDSSPTLSTSREPTVSIPAPPAASQPPWALIGGGAAAAVVAALLGMMLLRDGPASRGAIAQSEADKKPVRPKFVDSSVRWNEPQKEAAPAQTQPPPQPPANPGQPPAADPPPAQTTAAADPQYPPPPEYAISGEGKRGLGLLCRGRGYPTVQHTEMLEPEQLTVAAWVWCDALLAEDETRRWIVNKNPNETVGGHYALLVFGNRAGAYLTIDGDNHLQTEPILKAREWQHLAMTYDGNELKVFVDGVQSAARTVGKVRGKGNGLFSIGRRSDGYVPFHGQIDEVRVYSRALPEAELKQLIAAETAPREAAFPPELANGLAAHWSFDDLPVWELNHTKSAVCRVFEDTAYVPGSLDEHDEGSRVSLDFGDKYRGEASMRVTAVQSHQIKIPGLLMQIREKPALGEYRFLRFAWKKIGGEEACLQLGHDHAWGPRNGTDKEFRYHAGKTRFGASLLVAEQPPAEWTVVTRDLFADFGEFTFSGLAVSPGDGELRLDHVWLARSEADFDLADADIAAAAADWSRAPLLARCGLPPEEQKFAEGYGVELTQGTLFNSWTEFDRRRHAFYHDTELKFRVKVPPGAAGLLRLYLVDGANGHRQQRVTVAGREVVELGAFEYGSWIVVPVTAAQTESGGIDVVMTAITNKNAVCSEVEFLPQP